MSLLAEIYRRPNPHQEEVPRKGDLAEIRRSHCVQETGLILEVVNEPHICVQYCGYCGLKFKEYMVEVWTTEPAWHAASPGPWFYPIDWLKRIDPRDPLQFERVKQYHYLKATPEQLRAANK